MKEWSCEQKDKEIADLKRKNQELLAKSYEQIVNEHKPAFCKLAGRDCPALQESEMKKPNKTTTDNLKRTLVIHNLSVKEYKGILKFCKKKKINHATEVYDEEGFCVYLNAVANESITVEAELY